MRGRRLSRLLQIINLLRGCTSWNTRRLADHFNTSRRNIRRDLAVLELGGVPFYYDPEYGAGGGYRIQPNFFFPTINVSQQELVDLAVLTRGAESGNIPLLDGAAEVRDKLLTAVPPHLQDTIRATCELFEVLNVGVPQQQCREIMAAFQQALLTRHQVEGTYQSPHDKRAKKVQLQPRRVFLISNTWYAACDDPTGVTKLYRLARFQDARVSRRPMTVPREFSLRDLLGNAWTVFRGDRDWFVEVQFSPEAAPLVAEVNWHQTQELVPQADGSLIFRAMVSGLEEIKYWVLQWGPRAQVLKPKELAEEVKRLSRQIVEIYEEKGNQRKAGRPGST